MPQRHPQPSRSLPQLQATTAITLYTVGFDLEQLLVQWRLAPGTAIRELPASIAEITDGLAGVNGGSISLKLGGQAVPAVFDPDTLELRIPPESRTPPVGRYDRTHHLGAAGDGRLLQPDREYPEEWCPAGLSGTAGICSIGERRKG